MDISEKWKIHFLSPLLCPPGLQHSFKALSPRDPTRGEPPNTLVTKKYTAELLLLLLLVIMPCEPAGFTPATNAIHHR